MENFVLYLDLAASVDDNHDGTSQIHSGLAGTPRDCKCFPGDDCWPTAQEWSDFNATINGHMIATVPLAAACHDDVWASYNNATCTKLQNGWLDPETQ
jgi:hypothetical protein